jgi:hypothetical protein
MFQSFMCNISKHQFIPVNTEKYKSCILIVEIFLKHWGLETTGNNQSILGNVNVNTSKYLNIYTYSVLNY